ncbi:MAG: NnrU family protein [Wenzhouxiangellaceae bacterium]|nr:NnrU family protein [Wenzhouxiangellaceae bacterium]
MTQLIIGLVLFLGIHSLSIVSADGRDAMVSRIGKWPFKGLYSVVALIGLVLIVQGYGSARMDPTVLYTPPDWTRHISMLLMLFAFPAFVATYFPGRISAGLKHPMLVAVKTWALAHLIANGTLAAVLLFGGFLAWAVADRISMKHRRQRDIPRAPASAFNDVIAVVLGLGIYFAFVLWLHSAWIGVPIIG